MNELIAIPVESDRRAVAVLAALRRLEAEYAGRAAAAGPPAAATARRRRFVRRRLACAAFAVAALCASAAGAALLGRVSTLAAPAVSDPAVLLGAAAGGLLLAVAAGALLLRRRRPDRRAPVGTAAGSAVAWLVAYTVRDRTATGARRVRATVHQLTLPAEAEGRLKAILAGAAAPAAP